MARVIVVRYFEKASGMLVGVGQQTCDPPSNSLLLNAPPDIFKSLAFSEAAKKLALTPTQQLLACPFVKVVGRDFAYRIDSRLYDTQGLVHFNAFQLEDNRLAASKSSVTSTSSVGGAAGAATAADGAPTIATFKSVDVKELGGVLGCIGADVTVLKKRKCEVTDEFVAMHASQQLDGLPAAVGQRFVVCLPIGGTSSSASVQVLLTIKHLMDEKSMPVSNKMGGLVSAKSTKFLLVPSQADSARYMTWHSTLSSSSFASFPGLGGQAAKVFRPDWNFESMDVGGLNAEFGQLLRRAFALRLAPPDLVKAMGIKHVRGMVLYGPPGNGKTLIARAISTKMTTNPVKIVNGPEIMNKFVGASEENVRKLFEEARIDQKKNGDRASLHVIVIDEIDAICGQRSGGSDVGTSVHNAVVAQLLSMIDGVDSLDNILVIGMTNQFDMLDKALLRPGRLEVHIKIGLPDQQGRLDILKIHTRSLASSKFLSTDVDLPGLAARTKNFSGAEIEGLVKSAGSFALGPRIAVGNGSIALTTSSAKGDNKSAAADEKTPDPFLVKQEHFEQALEEVHPAFGTHEDDLQVYIQGGIMDWCVDPLTPDPREEILETTRFFLKPEGKSRLSTGGFLMLGLPGSGKTTLSADIGLTLASAGDCSFVKRLGFDQLSLLSESRKRDEIIRTFAEARQCKTALIILDDLDAILAHNRRTHQFSMEMMSTLQGAMTRLPSLPPPLRGTTAVLASPTTGVESKEAVAAVAVRGATHQNNKLMVLATCSLDFQTILQEIGLGAFFGWSTELPVIHNSAAFLKVAASVAPLHGEPQVERASSHSWPVKFPLGIRDVLLHLTPDL